MSKVQEKVTELRERFGGLAHALLCVGPSDLCITSRTMKVGRGALDPEVTESAERWLREDLALHASAMKLTVLAEAEIVQDVDETGCNTLAVVAITMPWSVLAELATRHQ